ncbi:MAG: hypothetical protein IMF18_06160 [Proteobacteria bacterium]|nr:hypothetical protein [Pseudomonadota bacterium]
MLAGKYKIVPVGNDIDLSSAAANDCDSINMKNYHKATFIVGFQDIGVAACYVALYSGATNGAKTSALTFKYAFGGAAQATANCDVLAAWAESAMLTVAHATYDNYMLVIEIDASKMDTANDEEWLTLSFLDTDTNLTGNVQVHAILEPRYPSGQSVTALV